MPADVPAPSALDALLAEVEVASKWMTYATRDYLARTAAPRLAAIIRALAGPAAEVLAAYDALVSGKSIPSYGAVDRLRTALARAEAIARGEES